MGRLGQAIALCALAACLSVGRAEACSVPAPGPVEDELERYRTIFSGEVLSVAIWSKRPGWPPIGYTPVHSLLVRVYDVFQGQVDAEVQLDGLTGCGVPMPQQGLFGVFFVTRSGRVEPRYFHSAVRASAVLARIRAKQK